MASATTVPSRDYLIPYQDRSDPAKNRKYLLTTLPVEFTEAELNDQGQFYLAHGVIVPNIVDDQISGNNIIWEDMAYLAHLISVTFTFPSGKQIWFYEMKTSTHPIHGPIIAQVNSVWRGFFQADFFGKTNGVYLHNKVGYLSKVVVCSDSSIYYRKLH
jgi:hypothetical protein